MAFASEWLQTRSVFPAMIEEAPDKRTGIIVVVPSFDEPSLSDLLDSLASCKEPLCKTEVIIVVNAPVHADNESIKNNRETLIKADKWREKSRPFFRLHLMNVERPRIKGWGVGLARKTGMDEALRRFDTIKKPDGVIACLDGDCTVADNYFQALEAELLNKTEQKACSVYFEHPVAGEQYPPEVYNAVLQYEIHLRYYFQALKYSGFPYVYHTVGSTIAVKAVTYMKAGGMNRRQAGEDFYFVQKLVPQGGYFSLNSTAVYPSPRISDRVPFGTGAAVGKIVGSERKVMATYNPAAFTDLKTFFQMADDYYKIMDDHHKKLYLKLPDSVSSFIEYDEWKEKLAEIKRNTSSPDSFKKRFFEWFNMFKVVKYLNFVHRGLYLKPPAFEASLELLQLAGYKKFEGDSAGLLKFLRDIERGS